MVRLLHLADLHLGWRPDFMGEKADRRQRERDGLLRRVVDDVLQQGDVDLVLIAGDLFETHTPDDGLAEAVVADLERLVAAGVALVTVPGNHDELTYADSVYRRLAHRWPGVLVQNPMPEHVATLDVGAVPVHVYGLAYTGGLTRLSPPLSDFPRLEAPGLHVAVFHGSLDWNAGERSLPLSAQELAKARYDYIALGHIHQHRVRKVGPGVAVYAGATEGKGFGDPGTGRLCYVRLGDGPPRVEMRPVAVRAVREEELDVTDLEDEASIAAAAGRIADPEAVVRLRLVGAAPGPLSPEAVAARLSDKYYFVDVVDETTRLDDARVAAFAAEPTVRGQFVRRLQAGLAAAADDEERALWQGALRRGLAALEGGGP